MFEISLTKKSVNQTSNPTGFNMNGDGIGQTLDVLPFSFVRDYMKRVSFIGAWEQ